MRITKQSKTIVNLSLISTTLTVLLASVSHAYFWGHHVFVAGVVLIVILSVLGFVYKTKANKVVLFFYIVLNTLVIIGFGIINGFWNHAIKVALTYLHGGQLPPPFVGLFQNPVIGTFFEESIGILTFIVSMFSAYYGFKLVQKNKIQTL